MCVKSAAFNLSRHMLFVSFRSPVPNSDTGAVWLSIDLGTQVPICVGRSRENAQEQLYGEHP